MQLARLKAWRFPAGCLAHARRKFDELLREGGKSAVADEALQRIARSTGSSVSWPS
ncbi:transposase [Hydrogenophaga taeniospiralis]|nr:transposase [Hydrogenophaga taeniospiralis]